MSILKQVILRHHSDNHLRFELPSTLCDPTARQQLIAGIGGIEGVYRVDLYISHRKLSIRFMEGLCDVSTILRRLQSIILALATRPHDERQVVQRETQSGLPTPLHETASRLSLWLQAKVIEVRETITALQIMARRALESSGLTSPQKPRWIKEFLNDLLMLYLIKIHWHHILHEWLPKPWTYRYEWAATIYLIYLSVESRSAQTA